MMKSLQDPDRSFINGIAGQYCRDGNCVGTVYDNNLDKFIPSKYHCCSFPDEGSCPSSSSGDCQNNVPIPCMHYFCGEVLVRLSEEERIQLKRIQDSSEYYYIVALCSKCGSPHVRYVEDQDKYICHDCRNESISVP